MIFWTEAPECMARNFGFCSSTASLTNCTGMDLWVDNHKLLCFQGRHGMLVLRYYVKCQYPKHQSIPDLCKLLDLMIYCWSLLRIGRVVLSDTVSIGVIPPMNRSLLSSFTGSSAIHFQHHLSWPPTQSFWTFSRPSFLSAKWPHWGSKWFKNYPPHLERLLDALHSLLRSPKTLCPSTPSWS